VPGSAPQVVKDVTGKIIAGYGDDLPVSALPIDGTFPVGTTKFEKRNVGLQIPIWDADICIQCGKCSLVCPHGVIRGKIYEPAEAEGAPEGFKSKDVKSPDKKGMLFTLQISPEDCTGCTLCVEVCPAKDKTQVGRKAINMAEKDPYLEQEKASWEFFEKLPVADRKGLNGTRVKDVQLMETLFEFSGACAGCGETPYVKILSQLFGDRALIANATGCSSIYGGNLPTTPWTVNKDGRGPAWSNSLFEDNAEFGFGMRLTIDKQVEYACELLLNLSDTVGADLVKALVEADQSTEEGIEQQRERVKQLRARLEGNTAPAARDLVGLADVLVKKSVWILGGDGWAYDIGYGGLDHVLASGRNVNVLVLDTEVYSNTGGQQSKATPRGAVAKFAAGGKPAAKKDLAMLAMTYGNIYVARIAMGSNDGHTLRAFAEAEAYNGPSLIIAYSHCIAHGYDLAKGMDQQKLAVSTGYWPLMRFNPDLAKEGKNPLQLDSKPPKGALKDYIYNETRYRMLVHSKPEAAARLLDLAQNDVNERWKMYERLAMQQTKEESPAAAPGNGGKEN
jgi:pyruvate-ferredoxin/flavodoxin oxidoreductase